MPIRFVTKFILIDLFVNLEHALEKNASTSSLNCIC
jgi:hypothetical protein